MSDLLTELMKWHRSLLMGEKEFNAYGHEVIAMLKRVSGSDKTHPKAKEMFLELEDQTHDFLYETVRAMDNYVTTLRNFEERIRPATDDDVKNLTKPKK